MLRSRPSSCHWSACDRPTPGGSYRGRQGQLRDPAMGVSGPAVRQYPGSARSGRSPRARKYGYIEPLKDSFQATGLRLSSARLGYAALPTPSSSFDGSDRNAIFDEGERSRLVVPPRAHRLLAASVNHTVADIDVDGFVRVRGALEHKSKGVDGDVPWDALVVFSGVSDSGTSSLASGRCTPPRGGALSTGAVGAPPCASSTCPQPCRLRSVLQSCDRSNTLDGY